jgi:hypothetical protein
VGQESHFHTLATTPSAGKQIATYEDDTQFVEYLAAHKARSERSDTEESGDDASGGDAASTKKLQ